MVQAFTATFKHSPSGSIVVHIILDFTALTL